MKKNPCSIKNILIRQFYALVEKKRFRVFVRVQRIQQNFTILPKPTSINSLINICGIQLIYFLFSI